MFFFHGEDCYHVLGLGLGGGMRCSIQRGVRVTKRGVPRVEIEMYRGVS